MTRITEDEKYIKTLIEPIRVCATYRPRMGQGADAGLSLAEFQALYRSDPFYSWYGLDHPMMYAAHKAAGGMTSVYRQIGIGGERLFRQLLQDHLGLTAEQSEWSYETKSVGGKARTLYLDGRIELDSVSDGAKRRRVEDWMSLAAEELGSPTRFGRHSREPFSRCARAIRARTRNGRTQTLRTPARRTAALTCPVSLFCRPRSTPTL